MTAEESLETLVARGMDGLISSLNDQGFVDDEIIDELLEYLDCLN